MAANNGVDISIKNGIQIIKFNNPKKRNAISNEAYKIIAESLRQAAGNPEVKLSVFTGEGQYYSSGFDISSTLTAMQTGNVLPEDGIKNLQSFIGSIIDYPKLLVALINGPALGIAVTTAALCDVIYAVDNSTFKTPFTSLGLCAEGCSSYTFPKILGQSKASEMLFLNHQMSAQEAHQYGLISEIFPVAKFGDAWKKVDQFATLPLDSIMASKNLVRGPERKKLHEVNNAEMETLTERFMSEDFVNAVMQFVSRKSKL